MFAERPSLSLEEYGIRATEQLLVRQLAAHALTTAALLLPPALDVHARAKKVHRAEADRLKARAPKARPSDERDLVHGGDLYERAVARLRRGDRRVREKRLRAQDALGLAATELRAGPSGVERHEAANQSLRCVLVMQAERARELAPPGEHAAELGTIRFHRHRADRETIARRGRVGSPRRLGRSLRGRLSQRNEGGQAQHERAYTTVGERPIHECRSRIVGSEGNGCTVDHARPLHDCNRIALISSLHADHFVARAYTSR
jgi:hypothetical protein